MITKAIEGTRQVAMAKGHTLGDFDTAQYGTSHYYRSQCGKCGARVQIEVNGESTTITGHAYTEACIILKH